MVCSTRQFRVLSYPDSRLVPVVLYRKAFCRRLDEACHSAMIQGPVKYEVQYKQSGW